MRVLIVGAGGMLGYTLYRLLSQAPALQVHGTLRTPLPPGSPTAAGVLHEGIDVTAHAALEALVQRLSPDVVINCVGLVKQLENANDAVAAIELNALLPHRLARMCSTI